MPFVFSANRLQDGSVVYLTEQNNWSDSFDNARILSDIELDYAYRIGQRAEESNLVVASYAVELDSANPAYPARLRERIRSHGPTTVVAEESVSSDFLMG